MFKSFVLENASIPLWNFLSYLSMTKTSFARIKSKSMWDELNIKDREKSHDRSQFLKTFLVYSHCLYVYSSGKCNQPLHLMLGDTLDKYSKSSDQCMEIFNSFGITVGRGTFERFQTKIAESHMLNAPFNDINRFSFAYTSLDNLDFLNKHARVRASVQGRGVNCTTYMAGQPKPIALKWKDQINDQPSHIVPVRVNNRPVIY